MEARYVKNEPAFPVENKEYGNVGINEIGMSKRFYAACMAMQGLLAGIKTTYSIAPDSERIVKDAYVLADELLKAE